MSKKTTYYWDACLFYEVLGNENVDSNKKNGLKEIMDANDANENYIITSVISHLEVLPSKLDDKGANDAQDFLSLFDALHYGAIEISTNIMLMAREIRDFYYKSADATGHGGKMMDLGDCIHLATAIIHGVTEFHTRDKATKGSKISLLKLYDVSGNSKVCGKYDLVIKSPESDQGVLI